MVSVTDAPSGFEGEGFPVRRAFAGVDLARLDPFVHMDQMGEVEYGPGEPRGTSWHPHRGFETVTYMIDGTFQHQDSAGGGGVITNGDTQWMTAGAGILHIERPPEALVTSGGLFHGIQLWVNLPSPRQVGGPPLPGHRGGPGGRWCRRPTAARSSASSPARSPGTPGPGMTHTPMAMAHVTVSPGARVDAARGTATTTPCVYVLAGEGSVGTEGRPVRMGQLAVFGAGDTIVVSARDRQESRSPELDVLVLGGRPIGEPVVTYGPFVMNTRAEIVQALDDFQHGKLGTIPADHIG